MQGQQDYGSMINMIGKRRYNELCSASLVQKLTVTSFLDSHLEVFCSRGQHGHLLLLKCNMILFYLCQKLV